MTDHPNVAGGEEANGPGLRLELLDHTARICFDRPPVNAFTVEMFGLFRSLMMQVAAEPRPVLLTAANGVFSAGFDIKQPGLDGVGPSTAARECLRAIQEHPAPVVAAVEGAAVGLGLLIAASADILIISRSARLRMPEVTLGIVSDVSPLRRLLPDPWVRRMCLLGEAFTASDLQLDGVGATLCEAGGSEDIAAGVLASLAGIEPSSLERTKRRLSE